LDNLDLSIIIINYNTIDLTTNCIKSINEKVLGIRYEIIVVDNASAEPNTKESLIILDFVRYIQSNNNLGFAKGNNLGIEHAKGEYVLLLNSDTELINDAVAISHEFIKKDSSIGVVSAQLQYPDGRIQDSCNRFPSIRYLLFERLRLFKLFPKKIADKILLGPFFDHQSKVQPDWVWGTFFMFPKSLLKKLPNNKLADDFFMYCEDIQWGLDIRQLGYNIQFLPEAKVTHYVGGSSENSRKHIEKNRKILVKKYYNKIHYQILFALERILN